MTTATDRAKAKTPKPKLIVLPSQVHKQRPSAWVKRTPGAGYRDRSALGRI